VFESFKEAERQRGLRGFLDRNVRPPRDAAQAEEGLQRIGIFFLSIAAVSASLGLTVYRNTGSLGTGLVLGLAALALYWSRSRTAALILLGLVLANALLRLRAPFSWVWVALAARATQLTFVYQRLRKASRAEPPRFPLK
jgi:hypothetical protein